MDRTVPNSTISLWGFRECSLSTQTDATGIKPGKETALTQPSSPPACFKFSMSDYWDIGASGP